MGTIAKTIRPLNEKERRLLSSALGWQKRRQAALTRRMSFIGLGVFVVFSGMVAAAEAADKIKGFAWYYSCLIGLAIAVPISLWVYFDLKPQFLRQVKLYESALRRNEATVIRICSSSMIEFEEEEDEGACYAYQLDNSQVVFVSGQDFYPSAKFPNSDFSVITICAEDGKPIESFIEKNGIRLKPLRKISSRQKSGLMIPDNFEVIQADLNHLEEALASRQ